MQEIHHQIQFDEKPQEKCGIVGVLSKKGESVTQITTRLQEKIQHRGHDTAGLAYLRADGNLGLYKGAGRVDEVFHDNFDYENSDKAIGHNRYGTSSKNGDKDDVGGAQPVISEWDGKRIAISYNGNLPEGERDVLRTRIPAGLLKEDSFDTHDIADSIVSAEGDTWEERIENGLRGVDMAYSLTILTDDGKLFGVRCPAGTWPLWLGETDDELILASETRVDRAIEGKQVSWSEVRPGELVEATPEGSKRKQLFEPVPERSCALHAVYGARPDSLMSENGVTYGDFRKRVGELLADENPIDADLYIGVPATGRQIALGYVGKLGKEITDAIRLKDSTRSYISKNPQEAAAIVNGKFEIPDPSSIEGKSVVLIDDSLIKGTTAAGDLSGELKGTVGLMKQAGASEVHFLAGMPKFIEGCDMGYVVRKDTLVALLRNEDGSYLERTTEEIAERIGADSFGFVSVDSLSQAFEDVTGKKDAACLVCLGGEHPSKRHEQFMTPDQESLILQMRS